MVMPSAGEVSGDRQPSADDAPRGWVCTYEGFGGAHAQAVFETAEQAMDFAERHAGATGAAMLEWSQVDDCWVLGTELGDYLVCSSAGQPPPLQPA
jgi:hypothetical protein